MSQDITHNTSSFHLWTSRRTFFVLLSLAAFTLIAKSFKGETVTAIDIKILNIIASVRTPLLTALMQLFTSFGSIPVLVLVLLSAILLLRRRSPGKGYSLVLLLSSLGAWVVELGLKSAFQRPRPNLEWLVDVHGYSFPSGHATVAVAIYGTLGYLMWHASKSSIARRLWATGMGLLAILMGASRVYLGVHYPSDVLAGFAIGSIWAIICVSVHGGINSFSNS